jgi:U3 small nucleolar RNA-associated protein 11
MLSSKSQAGRKIADRGNQVLDNDAVKLLKTQDAGYLRTMAQKTRKEKDRLKADLAVGESVEALRAGFKSSRSRHIVFVDDAAAQKHYGLEEENREPDLDADDSDNELHVDVKPRPGSSKPREKKDQSKVAALHDAQLLKRRRKREQQARAAKLEALKDREKTLMMAEMELEIQRARMQNSIGSVTKDGAKFKARIRKR